MYLYTYENLSQISKTEKAKDYIEKIKEIYEKNYENKPILALPFSKFKLFHLNGDRGQYQAEYFDRRKRLMLLQILAICDDKYIEPLEDIVSAICDELVWSVPAHCLDRETCNTYKYDEIDLFATETSFYLSETAYVFKDKLSPDILKRIKHSVKNKIVDVCETTLLPMDRMKNNWAPVCACGIGISYLYLFPERFNLVKDRLFSAMARYLNNIDSDGYCSEGFSYWVYGFGFIALFCDIYYQITEKWPKILDSEVVKNTLNYAKNCILGNGKFLPISDGGMTNEHAERDTLTVINRLFNVNISKGGEDVVTADTQALGLRGLYACGVELPAVDKNLGDAFFESSQVLIKREKEYIFISKGGHNAEMHNHNDIGSFSIFRNGKMYIVDPGAGEYTAKYFGDRKLRYSKEVFTCSSYAHSVPIVDGIVQDYGKEYNATVLERADDFITYDLANAYPKKIEKLNVKYSFSEKEVNALYEAKGIEKEISFRFISFIEPKIKGNEVLIDDLTITCDNAVVPTVKVYNYSGYGAIPTTAYAVEYTFNSDIIAKFGFKF